MLNAGFSTLDYLKSRLLPEAQREDTTWDEALGKLGLAIAGRFETHCNRSFARTAGAVDEFSGWNLSVTLRRLPVETITSVQIREADGTLSTIAAGDYILSKSSGVLSFFTTPGTRTERLVITYTGGFWLDPLDGTAQPALSLALPDDLLEIWLSEVQREAESRGTFEAIGLRAQKDADKTKLINGLSENAVDALRGYRRFAGE